MPVFSTWDCFEKGSNRWYLNVALVYSYFFTSQLFAGPIMSKVGDTLKKKAYDLAQPAADQTKEELIEGASNIFEEFGLEIVYKTECPLGYEAGIAKFLQSYTPENPGYALDDISLCPGWAEKFEVPEGNEPPTAIIIRNSSLEPQDLERLLAKVQPSHLQHLIISENSGFRGSNFKFLERCKNLTSLDLSNSLENGDLKNLAEKICSACPNLTRLHVRFCGMDNTTLSYFKDLPKLKK